MGSASKFYIKFQYFFLFFRLFGYCPFSRGNAILATILMVYSIISAIIPILIGINAFFIAKIFDDDSNSLSSIVATLVLTTVIITHFLNILQAFINRNDQLEIIAIFTSIDEILERHLLTRIDYQRIKKRLVIKIGITLLILIVIKIGFLVMIFATNGNSFWTYHAFPAFSLRIRCFQNMFYVDLVSEMLQIITKRLETLTQSHESKLNLILFVDRLRDRKNIDENSVYDEILLLKQIYGKVWDICNLINDSFGWSLLAITTQNFIEFTSGGYYLFLALEDFLPTVVAYECCCALLPLILILSMLSYSCFCCTQNVSKYYSVHILVI